MAGILDSVDQRTNLVGRNRLELLTFKLLGSQMFAINVFKVQEVQQLPTLNILPKSHPVVVGVTRVRDMTIPVIDLSKAIGRRSTPLDEHANIIVTEYNRSVQAFLIGAVNRIVNLNWEEVLPPPATSGRKHYLTAVTHIDGDIVEIIDVERVLAEVIDFEVDISDDILHKKLMAQARGMEVLLVDDSMVAIQQASSVLKKMGLTVHVEFDGLKALQLLQRWRDEGINVGEKLLMMITDAEMPEMDGYRLTTEIRKDPALKALYIILHTSLSGSFNNAMAEKVGCDDFLSKFQPEALAQLVQERVRQRVSEKP